MVLVLAACLFSGCLGDKVIGTWKSTDSDATITFNKDGTFTSDLGVLGEYQGTWQKEGDIYNLFFNGAKFGTAEIANDNLKVSIGGIISFNKEFVKQ